MAHEALDRPDAVPCLTRKPAPVQLFRRAAELDEEAAERSSGWISPRFSCQRRKSALLSSAENSPCVRTADVRTSVQSLEPITSPPHDNLLKK